MFWRRQAPPPPPPPFYKARPVATAAVVLTIIGMFVLGPIGAIYKGMTEELKTKANNETLLLYMQQQKEDSDRQWKEIERNREQKTISAPKKVIIKSQPKIGSREMVSTEALTKKAPEPVKQLVVLSVKDFKEYKISSVEDQEAFRETRPEIDWSRYKKWTK